MNTKASLTILEVTNWSVNCWSQEGINVSSFNMGDMFRHKHLLIGSDSYPSTYCQFKETQRPVEEQWASATRKNKSHLCRDASVPSVPQTDTRGWLHLVRGCPGSLVALPIWPHLQVLMDDIWISENEKEKMSDPTWQMGKVCWKWGRAQHQPMTSAGRKNTLLESSVSPPLLTELQNMSSRTYTTSHVL